MKTITSIATSYRAVDGTEFLTKELCIAHEQLCQLQIVIKDKWPSFFRNDTATVATMLIATWDQLCDAMEVHNEELISNSRVEPEQQAAPTRSNPTTVFDWYKEYPELPADVIYRSMGRAADEAASEYTIDSENYCTMYAVELGRILDEKVAAAAIRINWFDEYPELSVKVISDAMSAAAYEIAMTSHALCNSDEYKSLFAIELVGILDLAVAVHKAGKKAASAAAASAAYSDQFNPPSY